jgi:two-component system C4-dicarboxylate transport sensor histidine kinase DctB
VAERMGRITAQLKSFARKGQVVRRTVVLEQAISNVQLLLEHRTRAEQVHILIDSGTEALPLLYCDGVRLEQVLINLCTNALDAMACTVHKVLRISARPHNGRMLIGVADTGPAISDEIMQHLFEPFFSTKSAGEGLGLGLVISSNIVREFGSDLRVRRGDVGLLFEFDVALGQGGRHV